MRQWTSKLISAARGLSRKLRFERPERQQSARVKTAYPGWSLRRVNLARALSCAQVLAVLITDSRRERWLPAIIIHTPSCSFDDLCSL
jgi:hypothetical protein